MAYDVFISYSMKDRAVADAVCAILERRKIRCWIAPRDAPSGASYAESVVDAIDESRFMVLILSSNSNNSAHVTREVERAASRGTLVIPFRIEDVPLSKSLQYFIGPVRWVDALTPPLERHLNLLAGNIEMLVERAAPPPQLDQSAAAEPPRSAPVRQPWAAQPPPAPSSEPSAAPVPQPAPISRPSAAPHARPAPTTGPGGQSFPAAIGGLLSRAKSTLRGVFHSRAARRGEASAERDRRRSEASADQVHFSVTSPPAVKPGNSFVINVWAHLAHQRSEMIQRAQASLGDVRPAVHSKGPARVMRGTVLVVRLGIGELIAEDPEDTISWEGEISNATFGISVPPDVRPGGKPGIVRIYAQGLEIVRIHFAVEVDPAAAQRPDITVMGQPYRSAFVSYASEDRDAVLARIQGILKIAPELDIFVDVAKLRSGQDWETILQREIVARDVFYLFWSEYARASKWVDREWRYALQTRGLDFIDPVPLASPEKVPPPPELAGKHFNDWVLAYMRTAKSTVGERLSNGSRPAG